MCDSYIVTGVLTDPRTVTLDEALPVHGGKVRLVVEPLPSAPQRSYDDVVANIRARQAARGHHPPTQADVDAYLQAERSSWE